MSVVVRDEQMRPWLVPFCGVQDWMALPLTLLALKVGGSLLDAGVRVVVAVCLALAELAQTRKLVIGVGGGPALDLVKQVRCEAGVSAEVFERLARLAIAVNAELVASLIPGAVVVSDPTVSTVRRALARSGVVVLGPCGSQSDLSLLRVVNGLGVSQVAFVKDTPGIFRRVPSAVAMCAEAPIPQISLARFREDVCRLGHDCEGDHLIEDAALDYFEGARSLERVVFVDGRKPELLRAFADGRSVGSVLVKRERPRLALLN